LEPLLESDSSSRIHGLLSYAYSDLGKRQKAIDHGKQANESESGQNPLREDYLKNLEVKDIRDEPGWGERPDLFHVFRLLAGEESYSKAWEKGNELLDTEFDSSEFRRMLADVAKVLDFDEDAEHHYEKAIQLDPENGLAHHHYANFLKHQGRFEKARKRFKQGLEVSDEPEIYNDYGLLLMQDGSVEDGVEVLSLCLNKVQNREDTVVEEAQIHNNYAQALFRYGRKELAREHYQRAAELRDAYPEPLSGLGQLEIDAGNIDTAVEYLEEAMSLFAQNGQVEKWGEGVKMTVDALEDAGRIKDAINKCEEGIQTLHEIGGDHLPIFGVLQVRKSELKESVQS
jgi:Tfp pilus assembly protein PilF